VPQSFQCGTWKELSVRSGHETFGLEPGLNTFVGDIVRFNKEESESPEFMGNPFDPAGLPAKSDPSFVERGAR
jgi:hypothetical protein